jgi:hypothetical protein
VSDDSAAARRDWQSRVEADRADFDRRKAIRQEDMRQALGSVTRSPERTPEEIAALRDRLERLTRRRAESPGGEPVEYEGPVIDLDGL